MKYCGLAATSLHSVGKNNWKLSTKTKLNKTDLALILALLCPNQEKILSLVRTHELDKSSSGGMVKCNPLSLIFPFHSVKCGRAIREEVAHVLSTLIMIIRVSVVLRTTVWGDIDWRHLQSQVTHLTLKMTSAQVVQWCRRVTWALKLYSRG